MAARAAARLARFVTVGLAETDLSLPQYRLLAFLDDGGTAHADLAQLLTVSSPSVTALVDGLVARDYVERRKDTEDGRRIGFLRETNFGVIFEVVSRPDPNNQAYTHDELGLIA